MIEREFVSQRMKEYRIQEVISENLRNVGLSHAKMTRTPLGEKIVVYTSKPGLVVGRKGQNISKLTKLLKKKVKLDNPQIELAEVPDINLDAQIVAEKIANSLEKFGSKRFKGIMHKAMEDALNSGAKGIEIRLSGKIPSSRARSWRVYGGYIKKCGDVAVEQVRKAYGIGKLKSGVIGIKVSIMPPGIVLPDHVEILNEPIIITEEIKDEKKGANATKQRRDKSEDQ